VPWIVLGAAVAWLLCREWHYAGWMDDDAFISFRYARNLARGLGLVYNPGERVEGYTNFLWTVLMAVAAKAGLDVPRAAQVLGTVFSLASLAVVVRLAQALHRGSRAAAGSRADALLPVLPAVLLCVSESWAVWAVGGLENVFAGFWVLLAVTAYVRFRQESRRSALATCVASCVLASLTHPAHTLVALVLGAALAWHALRGPGDWRAAAVFAAGFGGLYGTYFVLRATYYASLLPNTFYAKVGTSVAMLQRGGAYWGAIVIAFPLLLAGCGWAGAQWFRQRTAGSSAERRQALPGGVLPALVGAYLLYALAIGGEAFPALRLFVVPLPLAAVAAAWSLQALAASLRTAAAIVLVVGTAACSYWNPKMRQLDPRIENESLGVYRTAGLYLKQNLPPNSLFAYSGAGVLAYYCELPFLDTLGLTDKHIARTTPKDMGTGMAGHEKGDGAYVLSRRPDYIMFTGAPISSPTPRFRSDLELNALQEFHFQYRPVKAPFRYTTRHGRTLQAELYLYQRTASR
jgi:arabinofuranosyltransferase